MYAEENAPNSCNAKQAGRMRTGLTPVATGSLILGNMRTTISLISGTTLSLSECRDDAKSIPSVEKKRKGRSYDH